MEEYDYDERHRNSISNIISFYKEQIRRFERIGIGNMTEFNTMVTERLLDVTRRRLGELQDKKLQTWIKKRGINGFE